MLSHHDVVSTVYVSMRFIHTFPTRRSSDLGDDAVFAVAALDKQNVADRRELVAAARFDEQAAVGGFPLGLLQVEDRKSTRLNSSHVSISYAVFCLNN